MTRRFLITSIFVFLCSVGFARQNQQASEKLKYVLLVSRHGVRSPTWTPERLNQYSAEPWPDWGTAPGNLTSHGRALMQLMGAYYREYLISEGLLSRSGCTDAARTFFWADTDQRTLETGRALSESILPGCNVKVQSLAEGENDPLFNPLDSGHVKM